MVVQEIRRGKLLYKLLGVFLLLSIGDILAVAKNYNATHVHSLILNIYKWNHTDSAGCRNYCSQEQPRLMHLYGLVAKLPNKSLTNR